MSESDLILSSDYVRTEKRGRLLYRNNSNYRNIVNVMEHPEFKEFFKNYFQDWTNTKTILMFMKLYEAIEKESNIPLTGYQKLAILDDIINDRQIRQKVVAEMNKLCSDEKYIQFSGNNVLLNITSTKNKLDDSDKINIELVDNTSSK